MPWVSRDEIKQITQLYYDVGSTPTPGRTKHFLELPLKDRQKIRAPIVKNYYSLIDTMRLNLIEQLKIICASKELGFLRKGDFGEDPMIQE